MDLPHYKIDYISEETYLEDEKMRDIKHEYVDDISFIHLNAEDVVRNRLVGDIVTAYGSWDENISKSTFPIRSGKGDR